MKKTNIAAIAVVLFAGFFATQSQAATFAENCASLGKPTVLVQQPKASVDRVDVSQAEIMKELGLSNEGNKQKPNWAITTTGMFHVEYTGGYATDAKTGEICVVPAVTLNVGLTHIQVARLKKEGEWTDANFEDGARYMQQYNHHVDLVNDEVAAEAPKLQKMFADAMGTQPVYGKSMAEIRAQVEAKIDSVKTLAFNAMQADLKAAAEADKHRPEDVLLY